MALVLHRESNSKVAGDKPGIKRILYVEGNVDGTVGGSYYLMYDLVRNLDKNKYVPVVVFYKNNFLVDKLLQNGIETYVLHRPDPFIFKKANGNKIKLAVFYQALKPVQRLINIIKRLIIPAYELKRFLKQKKIDLINLNNSINRNHEWMLASMLSNTKCITHEMGINKKFSFIAKFFGSQLLAIISLSDAITENMKKCGFRFNNIYTIHCGIDLSRYEIIRTPKELREKFGILEYEPIIGVVGNIKVWKGQETVIKATRQIKNKIQNIKCLLVGGNSEDDRYYLERLKKLCFELCIVDNVIFTGFQENPIEFMNVMDIVIHSSIEPEPFGIVNLEAMYVKKAIISTNIGAPTEIFENGKSGILVTPGDETELANACLYLLKNKEKAEEIGMAAYDSLINNFTLKNNIEKTEKVYQKVLSKKNE